MKTMQKPKLFKLYVRPDRIDALKKIAMHKAVVENDPSVTWVELVRRMIDRELKAAGFTLEVDKVENTHASTEG